MSKFYRTAINKFYHGSFAGIFDFIDDIEATYQAADLANTARWPEEYYSLDEKLAQVRYNFRYNAAWIDARQVWDYQVSVGVTQPPATPAGTIHGNWPRLACTAPPGGAILEFISPDGRCLLSQDIPEGHHTLDFSSWAADERYPMLILRLSAVNPTHGMNTSVMKCVIK